MCIIYSIPDKEHAVKIPTVQGSYSVFSSPHLALVLELQLVTVTIVPVCHRPPSVVKGDLVLLV